MAVIALIANVIRIRQREGVGLADGGNDDLHRAIRIHGNFIENVPLCLIVIAMVEATGHPAVLVHALGLAMLIGRFAHYHGLSSGAGKTPGRTIGMVLTFTVYIVGGATLVGAELSKLL